MTRIRTNEEARNLQAEIEANRIDTPAFGVHNDIRKSVYNYDHPYCSIELAGVEFRITDGFIRKHRGQSFKTFILYVDGQAWDEFYAIEHAKEHVMEYWT